MIPYGIVDCQNRRYGAIINVFTYVLASYEGIPNILIVLFILVVIYTFVMNKTVMGRHIYALGGMKKQLSYPVSKRNILPSGFLSIWACWLRYPVWYLLQD